jgi:hypothetical protein
MLCPMHAQRCRCALYLVKHSSQCTFIKTAVGFLTREDEAFCNGKWGTGLKENRHSPKTLQIQISWSKSPPAPPHSSSETSGHGHGKDTNNSSRIHHNLAPCRPRLDLHVHLAPRHRRGYLLLRRIDLQVDCRTVPYVVAISIVLWKLTLFWETLVRTIRYDDDTMTITPAIQGERNGTIGS